MHEVINNEVLLSSRYTSMSNWRAFSSSSRVEKIATTTECKCR